MSPKKRKSDKKTRIITRPKQAEVVVEQLYKTSSMYTDKTSDSQSDEGNKTSFTEDEIKATDETRDEKKNMYNEDFLNPIGSEVVIQSVVYKSSTEQRIQSRPTSEPTFESLKVTTPSRVLLYESKSDRKFNSEGDEYEESELEDSDDEEEREDDLKNELEEEREIKVVFETISKENMTMYFTSGKTIKDVKESLGSKFHVESDLIQLAVAGKVYDDGLCLSEFEEFLSPALTFEISSSKPAEFLSPGQFHRYKTHKKTVLFKLRKFGGIKRKHKEIKVEIENQNYFKEWFGGYRNKITNVEYHNQMVQTLPRQRGPDQPKIYSRATQTPTFSTKEFTSETTKNKSTQMSRSGIYVPNITDRIMIGHPARYIPVVNHVEIFKIVLNIVQVRKFFKKISKLRHERKAREDFEMRQENARKVVKAMHEALIEANRREIVGTTFPNDRENFYMLYLMIGKWWNKEFKTITSTKRNEARKAAVYDLLIKEIEFLCVIDRQRNQAKKEILAKQEITFLETTARPIIFRNNKGQMSSLDNVATQQAREYQEILSSYLRKNVTKEQRIDILQNLHKLILNYGSYETSKEILDLIERECDLMSIGMTNKQLATLRQRILQLLQFYLHEFEVNPRAATYERPRSAKTVKTLYMCNGCRRLKPANDFNVHVRMAKFEICHSCEWTNNIACKRQNLSPYARLLQQIRESEMKQCCTSSVCYVLQPVGMNYLVSKIWNDESIISECKRIDELRMNRFRKNEDWSPWNCILLTLEESTAHDQIVNVDEFYDEWLIRKIHIKHIRAKNVFLPLILNDWQMRHTGLWFDVTDADKFLHPSHIKKFATSGDFSFFN